MLGQAQSRSDTGLASNARGRSCKRFAIRGRAQSRSDTGLGRQWGASGWQLAHKPAAVRHHLKLSTPNTPSSAQLFPRQPQHENDGNRGCTEPGHTHASCMPLHASRNQAQCNQQEPSRPAPRRMRARHRRWRCRRRRTGVRAAPRRQRWSAGRRAAGGPPSRAARGGPTPRSWSAAGAPHSCRPQQTGALQGTRAKHMSASIANLQRISRWTLTPNTLIP